MEGPSLLLAWGVLGGLTPVGTGMVQTAPGSDGSCLAEAVPEGLAGLGGSGVLGSPAPPCPEEPSGAAVHLENSSLPSLEPPHPGSLPRRLPGAHL